MRQWLSVAVLMSVLLVAGAYASGERSGGSGDPKGGGVFSTNLSSPPLSAKGREASSRITKVKIVGRASMSRFPPTGAPTGTCR